MIQTKLPNICLCAIVRDEEINPAGGIQDFLDCTLPFVENAVIVDTGSTDKTREILEDAKSKYPNLKVEGYLFDGYAQARNFSLVHARNLGDYALVLDADERLFAEDFSKLNKTLESNPAGINFMIQDIFLNTQVKQYYSGLHNPRCFSLKTEERFHYKNIRGENTYCEWLYTSGGKVIDLGELLTGKIIDSEITIKHFLPPTQNGIIEKENWYTRFKNPLTQTQSQDSNFPLWKQLNPKRREFN
jgi:glycosyltransferase involved in cell wall biosynthesis